MSSSMEPALFAATVEESGDGVGAVQLPDCACTSLSFRTANLPKAQSFLREHFESGAFQRALVKLYGEGLICTPHYNHQEQYAQLEPLLGKVNVKFPSRGVFLQAWCSTRGTYKTRNVFGMEIVMKTSLTCEAGCPKLANYVKKGSRNFSTLLSVEKFRKCREEGCGPVKKVREEKKVKSVAPSPITKSKRQKTKEKKKILKIYKFSSFHEVTFDVIDLTERTGDPTFFVPRKLNEGDYEAPAAHRVDYIYWQEGPVLLVITDITKCVNFYARLRTAPIWIVNFEEGTIIEKKIVFQRSPHVAFYKGYLMQWKDDDDKNKIFKLCWIENTLTKLSDICIVKLMSQQNVDPLFKKCDKLCGEM